MTLMHLAAQGDKPVILVRKTQKYNNLMTGTIEEKWVECQ